MNSGTRAGWRAAWSSTRGGPLGITCWGWITCNQYPRSGLGLDVAIMDRKLLGSSGVDVAYTAAEIGIFEAVLGMRDRPCGPLGSWGDRDG